jgi:WD40 repeat protein
MELLEHITYISFNQDGSCFCVGTENGFSIYNSYPLKLLCKRDLDGGIGIVEMLNHCNIIGLVGGGNNPKFDRNRLIIWDDFQCKVIAEIVVTYNIQNIKLKKEKIFIIGEIEISVFTFGNNYQKIDSINTCQNKNGIFGISLDPNINIICFPSIEIGKINIKNYDNNDNFKTSKIKAHQSEIVSLVMNYEGSLVASASIQGTIIRIYQTKDGALIQELRRGTKSSEIYSLVFDFRSQYIACSSNKGTIHIFNVKNEQNLVKNQKSILGTITSFLGIQSDYLNSEWSFSQYRLDYKGKHIINFCNDHSIIVLTLDGNYYLGEFNTNSVGECTTSLKYNFLQIDFENDDE